MPVQCDRSLFSLLSFVNVFLFLWLQNRLWFCEYYNFVACLLLMTGHYFSVDYFGVLPRLLLIDLLIEKRGIFTPVYTSVVCLNFLFV